jgi:DNA topoisomerase-1
MEKKYVQRKRCGKGFRYQYLEGDSSLSDPKLKNWIKSLAIPPAWRSVKIDLNKRAKVHAVGRDSKGRKQYIYNDNYRKKREREKFDHIVNFAKLLPSLRIKVSEDLHNDDTLSENRVLALQVKLLDDHYFRVGSRVYAKKNKTFGLTTLRSKHMVDHGDYISFKYTGKSGKEQTRKIQDKVSVSMLRALDESVGYKIFKFEDESSGERVEITRPILNQYIKNLIGDDYSAKDFRTWAGTCLAAALLSELGPQRKADKAKKNILSVIDEVAKALGNTRAVARASYVDPRVIEKYKKGKTIKPYLREVREELTSDPNFTDEAVISFLTEKT